MKKVTVENENLPSRTLLRPHEVAVYFGVSRKTVYRWCDVGLIDSIKVGGVVRIYRKSILRFAIKAIARRRAKHAFEANRDI